LTICCWYVALIPLQVGGRQFAP